MKRILAILFALAAVIAVNAQEFTMVNGAEPASLDPHYVESVPDHRIYQALFEGLTSTNPETNRAIPGIAESWKFSKDNKIITFYLRKNAVWSDGVPITATTCVQSWQRKIDPKNAFQYADMVVDFVAGADLVNTGKAGPEALKVKAISDYIFEVTLKNPTPFFADVVAHYAFAIVPIHAIQKFGQDWVKPGNIVSNGAFVLESWKAQDKLTVVKNPKYWDASKVMLKRITFLPIDDLNTAWNLYKSGGADWIDAIPAELKDEIKLRKDFHEAPEYGTYYYIINFKRKPLDDVRVRKALAMAFDKKEVTTNVAKTGVPAMSFVPPSAGYPPAKGVGYNPEEARKLLAAAGFPGGKGFPAFQILYNTSSNHKRIAEYIQAQWKTNLGIEVTLVNQEFNTYLDTRSQAHDFDIARAGWIADYLDPFTFTSMWIADSTQNDGAYNNPKYDALLEKSKAQLGDARLKTMGEAEKILIDEDMAIIPIYFYTTQNVIDLSKWSGWYPNPMNSHPWKFIGPKK
jgi:oligopeptide transport system substrate-binding protein